MARRRRSGTSALRGALYGLARLLGDVQAASSGDPAKIARPGGPPGGRPGHGPPLPALVRVGPGGGPGALGGDAVVILPGSTGWLLTAGNQELAVEGLFVHPKEGLRYRGRRVGEPDHGVVSYFPVAAVGPIPGVSRLGVRLQDGGREAAAGGGVRGDRPIPISLAGNPSNFDE